MCSGSEGGVSFLLDCGALGLLQNTCHSFTSLGRVEEEREFIRA